MPNPHPLAWRKKPRVGCHCHGHSGRFLLAGHLPYSRCGGREGVNPQSRKGQRIILDPTLHPTSSGSLRPRDLTRRHCEGHSPAKTQTNCDSYDITSATVNTVRTIVGLCQPMDESLFLLFEHV